MAILEGDIGARFSAPPAPRLEVVQDIPTVRKVASTAQPKYMACMPPLFGWEDVINVFAQGVNRAAPDYHAEAIDVFNAGPLGAGKRVKKGKDEAKRNADKTGQTVAVAGHSWGSLDALAIAQLPEVDEVVLLLSPHHLKKLFPWYRESLQGTRVINLYSRLDPVTAAGGKFRGAINIPVLTSHVGAANPLEVNKLVRAAEPHFLGASPLPVKETA